MPTPGVQTTLTLGTTVTLPAPFEAPGATGASWSVEIDNVSPWVLLVDLAGTRYNLAPGMGQVYFSTTQDTTVRVTPTGTAATGTFYALTNWAVTPDYIPGTFPVVIAPALTAGNVTVTGNVGVSGTVTTLPPVNGQLYSGGAPTGKLAVANAGALGIKVRCGTPLNVSNTPYTLQITWYEQDQTTVRFTETWTQYASGAGNGPNSTLIDVFPVFAPYFQITAIAGTGPLNIVVWAASLSESFERPSPQSYVTVASAVIGAGASQSIVLGTGGQSAPAGWSVSPDFYYVPGSVDLWGNSSGPTLTGFFTISEWNGSAFNVIGQQQQQPNNTVPWRASITRNTPLLQILNSDTSARTVYAAIRPVRQN